MAASSVAAGVVYLLAGVDLCVYGDGVLLLLLRGLSERSIWILMSGMHERCVTQGRSLESTC